MKKLVDVKLTKKGDSIEFVASDETLDRSGEVIKIESWDLTNFMMNPVLLVNHDYKVENIVGLAKNLRIEDRQLKFTPEFHSITELAKNVKEMVTEGILNTVSVGFLPHGPAGDGDIPRNELLEISFVPVPANQSAQRLKALADQVKAEEGIEVTKWVKKQNEILDAIRLEFTDSTEDEAKAWAADHKYKIIHTDFKGATVVLHLVGKDVKCEGEEKEIQIDTNIKLFACRLSERATNTDESKKLDVLEAEVKDLLNENAELKEGRVLSGKNRKIINDALSSVKAVAEVLESVLQATDSDPSKDGDNGRTSEVEHGAKQPKKVASRVVRALQEINKTTNNLLADIKE